MSVTGRVADASRAVPRETVASQHLQSVKRRFVLTLNIVSGAGLVGAVIWAVRDGITFLDVALFAAMYTLTAIGITVGYHRYFAHAAFETSTAVKTLLAIAGSMAGHGPVISWTATHRCHHKHSDVDADPHSPNLHGPGIKARLAGLWHAHLGWLLNDELPNSMVFAKDLLRDSTVARVNQLYLVWVALGVVIPALVAWTITGSIAGAARGLLWGGLARIFVGFHATSSINSITHSFGRRAFDTPEHSTNLAVLALPTFGEGWHNNHHAFPSSARLGLLWWEIDLGYAVIRVMEMLGLVWNVKQPTGSSWNKRIGNTRNEGGLA